MNFFAKENLSKIIGLSIAMLALIPGLALAYVSPAAVQTRGVAQTCPVSKVAEWNFTGSSTSSLPGDTITANTGNGTLNFGPGLDERTFTLGNPSGSKDPGLRTRGWSEGLLDTANNDYIEFLVNTSTFTKLSFSFAEQRSGNSGPLAFALFYATDGINYTQHITASIPDNTAWRAQTFDLSAISGLENQSSIGIRIYGYQTETSAGGRWVMDDIALSGESCAAPTPTPSPLPPTATPAPVVSPTATTIAPLPPKAFLPYLTR